MMDPTRLLTRRTAIEDAAAAPAAVRSWFATGPAGTDALLWFAGRGERTEAHVQATNAGITIAIAADVPACDDPFVAPATRGSTRESVGSTSRCSLAACSAEILPIALIEIRLDWLALRKALRHAGAS
jgi:hypothetical protein